MVSKELVTQLRERGYNLYASCDPEGNRLPEPFIGGLVVTPDEFAQVGKEGRTTAQMYFHDAGRETRFCLAPICRNPLSPEEVWKEIRSLENSGRAPYGLMGKTWFSVVDFDNLGITLPASLPKIN